MDIIPMRPARRRRRSSDLLPLLALFLLVALMPTPSAFAEDASASGDAEAIQPLESQELITDEGAEEVVIPTPIDFERIEAPEPTTTDPIPPEPDIASPTEDALGPPADDSLESEEAFEKTAITPTTDASLSTGGVTPAAVIQESIATASQEPILLPPAEPAPPPPSPPPPPPEFPGLPDNSGHGRRVVYSNSQQRVWLVEDDGSISGSWLVSGRRGTPRAGHYRVFSRSRHARSVAGARMEYMIRFARGRRLAIGFHSIPISRRGRPLQSNEELGQYRSAGCVRQHISNAEHLWNWAGRGTSVVVTR